MSEPSMVQFALADDHTNYKKRFEIMGNAFYKLNLLNLYR